MKGATLAEQHVQAAEIAVEHFRDSFLLVFRVLSDGLPEQYGRQTRKVLDFFEKSTTPETWETLKMIPDADNPGMSLADSWLAQWERADAIVGKPDKSAPKESERVTPEESEPRAYRA